MLRFTLSFITFSFIGILGLNIFFTYNIKKELNLLKESVQQGRISIEKSILDFDHPTKKSKPSGTLIGRKVVEPIAKFSPQFIENDISTEFSDYTKFLNTCEEKNKDIARLISQANTKLIENNKKISPLEFQIKAGNLTSEVTTSNPTSEQEVMKLLQDVISINAALVHRSNKFRELAYNSCMHR